MDHDPVAVRQGPRLATDRLLTVAGARPAQHDTKRKNPGWSGPGFKVYAAWLRGEDSNL